MVAEHELTLHLGRVDRVEGDVITRVVAELEPVLDEPAQRLARGAAVPLEGVARDVEGRDRREVGMLLREVLHDPERGVRVERAVREEADLVVGRVVERHHDRRLALRDVHAPGHERLGGHRVEAVAPEPGQLAEELRRRQVVGASVQAELVVHQHRHDAELLRLYGARDRRLRRRRELGLLRVGRERGAGVGDQRIPEQELGMPASCVAWICAPPAPGRSGAEREVLEPRNDARACSLRQVQEVLERAEDDVVRLRVRVATEYSPEPSGTGRPSGRRSRGARTSSGCSARSPRGVAAMPKTDAPRNVLYGCSARASRPGSGRSTAPGSPLEPREHHRSAAVGPADVVVEDVVHPELGRGHGDLDLVLRTCGFAKLLKPP